eukprot:CAMPEP_0181033268 /NCGR_PEP_ID=MMETSP1070-20121207/7167_1 /TAXON_ID=265543 /ORGANISM="Minutocellus polymorphus, Strain NH13" /LENGTH=87 /DNA_ID=CAMNT_0023110685 /DNA_START=214 /DNA_END=477 /DNA_ORIENTATION=-
MSFLLRPIVIMFSNLSKSTAAYATNVHTGMILGHLAASKLIMSTFLSHHSQAGYNLTSYHLVETERVCALPQPVSSDPSQEPLIYDT